jgi:hypothetical protein
MHLTTIGEETAAHPIYIPVHCPKGERICKGAYILSNDTRTLVCPQLTSLRLVLCPGGESTPSAGQLRKGEAVPDKEARLPGVQHSRLADVRRFSITMLRGRLGSVTLSGLAVLSERTPAAVAAAATTTTTAKLTLRSFLFWGWWRVSPATSSAFCGKVSPTRQLLQRPNSITQFASAGGVTRQMNCLGVAFAEMC